jgi:hypothetical protein
MSTEQLQVMVPARIVAPRGARWAAQWVLRLAQRGDAASAPSPYKRQTPTLLQALGQTIWQALEGIGQRRAARELRNVAQRWDSIDPAIAQQLHDAVRHLKEPR